MTWLSHKGLFMTTSVKVDIDAVIARLKAGETIKLTKEFGGAAESVKKKLQNACGTSLQIKRGRNGGVFLTPQAS